MIHDAGDTLSKLLAEELARIPGCPVRDAEQITFDPPTVIEAMQDGEARVNLYLFDVREDLQRRDEGGAQSKANSTGLPDNLKVGVENLSGMSMNDVHYNSSFELIARTINYNCTGFAKQTKATQQVAGKSGSHDFTKNRVSPIGLTQFLLAVKMNLKWHIVLGFAGHSDSAYR